MSEQENTDIQAKDISDAGATWAVWRQDDNGNRFFMSGGYTHEEAEQICRRSEARGHKQFYWASKE